MKQVTLLFITLFLVRYSFSQKNIGRVCFLGKGAKLHDWPCIEQQPTQEDSVAHSILNTLLKPIGLKAEFIMRECSEIQNFAALISEDPQSRSQIRYILYNKAVIDSIADPLNKNWNKKAIYLHELAHHLNNNISNSDDKKTFQQELDADEFSGTQMAKLKANLAQAQGFLSLIDNPSCEDDADHSHPCLEKRLNAVVKGWYSGMGLEEFYASTAGKIFCDSFTAKDGKLNSDTINYFRPKDFFELKHCIRSTTPCSCNVFLREVNFKIDFQTQSSTLTLKLEDEGRYARGKRNHLKIDTTIYTNGHFKNLVNLLPDEIIEIDFAIPVYNLLLKFYGKLTKLGIITGSIRNPAGTSLHYRNYPKRTFQEIGYFTLRPK